MVVKSYDFKLITNNFNFEGVFQKAEPYGFGHINDTFAVYFEKSNHQTHRYILQRINHNIFKNVDQLMQNIENVTKYIRDIIISNDGNPEREGLTLILSNGKSYYKDELGDFWRAYIFIENASTYQLVENPDYFYNAGLAFGSFQYLLENFPASSLFDTIPNFHNTQKRFEALQEAILNNLAGRVNTVQEEINFALSRKQDASVLIDLLNKGDLPLRVTHNDTKLNNVMLDDITGIGICVIDLDTVMPGLAHYDFGDSIRTGASTGEEDETDLSKVQVSLPLFEMYTKGFLKGANGSLTQIELDYLAFSAKLMTYECGCRFLTDYLNGDTYFKIHYPQHNLDRCRTQFKLVEDMEEKMEQMKEIVKKCSVLN